MYEVIMDLINACRNRSTVALSNERGAVFVVGVPLCISAESGGGHDWMVQFRKVHLCTYTPIAGCYYFDDRRYGCTTIK